MYLLADFRTLDPKPILPSTNVTPHKQRLFPSLGPNKPRDPSGKNDEGGVILQILDIRDVGLSSLRMLEAVEAVEAARGAAADDPGNGPVAEKKYLPKSFLALDVTDGVRKAKAMIMSEIPGIAIDIQLGAKIRVQDVEFRHGILQLDSKNTVLLGGEVAELNEKPRIEAIMYKMQERLGLLPNAAAAPRPPGANSLAPVRARTPLAMIPQPARTIPPTNNIWSNHQPAVTAADAIPAVNTTFGSSTTRVNSTTLAPHNVNRDIPNPWRVAPPGQQPPLTTPPPAYDQVQREDHDQFQWQEEPQWDQFNDMDVDDDIGNWAVLSQLSVEELVTSQPTNRQPTMPPQLLNGTPQPRTRDWRKESPPLIATRSPAKKRILSLRAPRASPQPKRTDRPRGTWEVESFSQSTRNEKRPYSDTDSDTEEGGHRKNDMDIDPFADRPRSLSQSPILDLDDDGWQKMDNIIDSDDLPPRVDYEKMMANIEDEDYRDDTSEWLFRRHTSPILDDFEDNDYMPFEDDVFSFGALSQKRGAQDEEEDKKPEDGYTNRRRSQSFSLLPRRVESMDVDTKEKALVDVKTEMLPVLSGDIEPLEESEDIKQEIKISQSRESSPVESASRNLAENPEKLSGEELKLELVRVKTEMVVKSEAIPTDELEPAFESEQIHQPATAVESRSMEDVQTTTAEEPPTATMIAESELEQRGTSARTSPEALLTTASPVALPSRTLLEATPARMSPEATPARMSPEATPARMSPEATPARMSPVATPARMSPVATPARMSPVVTSTRASQEPALTRISPQPTPTRASPEAQPATKQNEPSTNAVDTFDKRSGGSTYQEAIALSSDDDDDVAPAVPVKMSCQEEVKSLDIHRVIKTEPGLEAGSNVVPTLVRDNSVTVIKQEETLLEFDMDDMDDFGILKAVTVPEVEVQQVAKMVQEGMEVRTKARVHKLGKFSLTTLSVSIPIILLPATEPSLVDPEVIARLSSEESLNEMFEGVLDQDVIEKMFDISIAQFRRLVRDKESEAREAVTRLRSRFSEARTVECRFKGLRGNVPVVRELKVLTKKSDSPSVISFSQASSV
ncbi:hypothetical protein EMPS_09368 [Entomortierella parvispora]|uniref:RecQ-mediated genome instability protein 1 n=1 Tax=Entomortierella parvispora TaxID=205924 RepID=A0A9P3HHU9_9FUNG|nr:hypothetical protein EMPS_09368 [Entomortierella parvispora]